MPVVALPPRLINFRSPCERGHRLDPETVRREERIASLLTLATRRYSDSFGIVRWLGWAGLARNINSDRHALAHWSFAFLIRRKLKPNALLVEQA